VPFALVRLLEGEPGPEAAAAAATEARHLLGRVAAADQLARDGDRELLAGFRLPDHEAAAGVVARPARVPLAVLDDLVPADGARPEPGARDPHVFERLVQGL